MRGGAQGPSHQHLVSNEGPNFYAVQWKVVAGYGFTWEAQEPQEVARKSLLTLKNKWIHPFKLPLSKQPDTVLSSYAKQSQPLTDVLLFSIYPINPEPYSYVFLSPSPGFTVRKHILFTVSPQVPQHSSNAWSRGCRSIYYAFLEWEQRCAMSLVLFHRHVVLRDQECINELFWDGLSPVHVEMQV